MASSYQFEKTQERYPVLLDDGWVWITNTSAKDPTPDEELLETARTWNPSKIWIAKTEEAYDEDGMPLDNDPDTVPVFAKADPVILETCLASEML